MGKGLLTLMAKNVLPRFQHTTHSRRSMRGGFIACSDGDRTSRAQSFDPISNIPVLGIFPPDPPIGFQGFSDSSKRFKRPP